MPARASGILLHPTSLPGPHGIGDLGPTAYHFVDWLVAAGQRLWQVLPLNPIGPGHSPYASVSVFAGSPLLVALEPLIDAGWLAPIGHDELHFDAHRVDFERVIPWRMARLREAARGFFERAEASALAQFEQYVAAEAEWLEDYALFMAIDSHYPEIGAWQRWPAPLARRSPEALAAARVQYREELEFWRFVQWCFDRQWANVKRYANERGIRVIGDLPIFVAGHGADIWSRSELYLLDRATLEQAVVAGVPPDFFSKTGQRWGNPLYDWEAMAGEGFSWWIARVRRQLALADLLRIDHFRGFSAYWEIPAESELATDGRWVPGPGAALFEALRAALGGLPLIAEDLGIITEEVELLRDQFELPGMKIVQFGFTGTADHPFLPHNYPSNCVVYTGTHDNDTIRGWYAGASERERSFAREYLNCDEANLPWSMIRAASSSVANHAIYSMQDLLGLGGEHRMNRPGEAQHNWAWRFVWAMIGPEPARWLGRVSAAHGRTDFARLGLGD